MFITGLNPQDSGQPEPFFLQFLCTLLCKLVNFTRLHFGQSSSHSFRIILSSSLILLPIGSHHSILSRNIPVRLHARSQNYGWHSLSLGDTLTSTFANSTIFMEMSFGQVISLPSLLELKEVGGVNIRRRIFRRSE